MTHRHEAGLLQLRSLASYLLLQSPSAKPSRPHHVRRSKLRQHTPYRVSWRLSTRTRPPRRVADMVDEAEEGREAEAEEDGCLRIREASHCPLIKVRLKIPHSVRMTPINVAKGCHPCPFALCDVWFVPVILYLASPSRFPPEWRFCLPPGMCRCRCDNLAVLPVGTRLRSLLGEGHKREVTV